MRKTIPILLGVIFITFNISSLAKQKTLLGKEEYRCENNFCLLKIKSASTNHNVVDAKSIARKNFNANTKVQNLPNTYSSYLQVGGTRFFNVKSSDSSAAGLDFFIPLWQSPMQLIFTDIRFYDRSGKALEGNVHLGYRQLSSKKQYLYGIYGAFDRKRSDLGHYFNQLTFGGELWLGKLFVGANFYQPIGEKTKLISKTPESAEAVPINSMYKSIWITEDRREEKAMRGADAEVGYEIINGLIGYIGGYYFKAKKVNSIYGPRIKLSYDFSLENGGRILGIFDKFGLEAGIQRDKPRGTTTYLSANFRIGLSSNKNSSLQGIARHMVDLVHRDVDIVSNNSRKKERNPYVENGKVVRIREVSNKKDFLAALADPEANKISVKGHIADVTSDELEDVSKKAGSKTNQLIFEDKLVVVSDTGKPLTVDIHSSSGLKGSISQQTARQLNQLEAKIQ